MNERVEQDWSARQARNTRALAGWTATWLTSLALVIFGSKFLWSGGTVPTALALALNVGLGIGMIVANRRHLNDLDELQRQLHMQAMGLTLGVGLVGGLAYSTMDVTNLIGGDAEIPYLVMLMSLTYLGGIIRAQRKYR